MKCRFCHTPLGHEFIDLVNAPPSNAFLTPDQLDTPEVFYPLKLYVCTDCHLVQIGEYKRSEEIFSDAYLYFSSYSRSWLDHARRYVEMITDRLKLGAHSLVIEIASNDGYLLQYFKAAGVPCLGIEPAESTAAVARKKGIEVIGAFFGKTLASQLAAENRRADLIVGNNVLAHVPDINDFVAGIKTALKDHGVATMEFPHLLQLVENNQFDTIYHEHFSYFSFKTAHRIFSSHGLTVFDVEELPTHGGSIRIYAGHQEDQSRSVSGAVSALLEKERTAGMDRIEYYSTFQTRADAIKCDLLKFLIEQKRRSQKVIAYGAAAKGNTLLNYCGIKKDLIAFAVDASPHKQGRFLPGSHIPVVSEEKLREAKPDFIVILPWNIQTEIMEQLSYVRQWGGGVCGSSSGAKDNSVRRFRRFRRLRRLIRWGRLGNFCKESEPRTDTLLAVAGTI